MAPAQAAHASCHPKRCRTNWGTAVLAIGRGLLPSAALQAEARCRALCVGSWTAPELLQASQAPRWVRPLSGGSGGGALRGGGATGSGALTSSTACGMNLAVGDSVLLCAGCLLCGDGARLGGARCAGGSLGIALTGGVWSGSARGRWSAGCPNDGAEVEAELEETAVCKGRERVGVADGDLLRRGDGVRRG